MLQATRRKNVNTRRENVTKRENFYNNRRGKIVTRRESVGVNHFRISPVQLTMYTMYISQNDKIPG